MCERNPSSWLLTLTGCASQQSSFTHFSRFLLLLFFCLILDTHRLYCLLLLSSSTYSLCFFFFCSVTVHVDTD